MHLKTFNLCLLILFSTTAFAQKKVEYYPNGNKSFEGDYIYNWPSTEVADVIIEDSTVAPYSSDPEQVREMDMYAHFYPEKLFFGTCTFYYPNGKKNMTGNYTNGYKNGKFTMWYSTGEKMVEKTYVNGMADGTWTHWDKNGDVIGIETYKAVSQKALADFWHSTMTSHERSTHDELNDMPFNMARYRVDEQFRRHNFQYVANYMYYFTEAEKKLFMRTSWNGPFILRGTTNRHMSYKGLEMYFDNDIPSGTWKVYDDSNKLACQVVFKNGKIASGKIYNQTFEELDKKAEEEMATRNNRGANKTVADQKPTNNTQQNQVPPNAVFNYVEQMPEASFNTNKFIADSIKYPEKAKTNNIQGRVVVQFVVNEDGSLSDIKVVRGIDPECDNEAIRLIEAMPNWKPGKQNGKPVKVKYTLPITFTIKK